MTCNFCDGQCSCHVNPPCSFCVTHVQCDMCGQVVCEDKVEEVVDKKDGTLLNICPDCADEIRYGKVIGVSVNGTGIS